MIDRLTDSLAFHAQALTLRAERQRLIAGNIANADTPGYQARDFDFASALRNATGGTSEIASGIARGIVGDPGPAGAELRYVQPLQTNLDSNTVDMDRERAAFMENAFKYESTLRFVNSNVRNLLDAMKSHNQA